jgi:hypothetical protein
MGHVEGANQADEKPKTGRWTRLTKILVAIGGFVTAIALFGSNVVSIRDNFSKLFSRETPTIPIALTEVRVALWLGTDLRLEMHVQNKSREALEECGGQLNINRGVVRVSTELAAGPDNVFIPAQRTFDGNTFDPIVFYFFKDVPTDVKLEEMELRVTCAKPRTIVSNWEKLK